MSDTQHIDNLRGWRDTLMNARIKDNTLIDEEGYEIYFLAVDEIQGEKSILVSWGGPGLRIYMGQRPGEVIMRGFSWGDEYEEVVSFPEHVYRVLARQLT